MSKWETINDQDNSFVQRLKIDGGWLYHLVVKHTDYAQTLFVPEPEKCSYHNEYLVKCCYTCQRAKPYNFDSVNLIDLGLLDRTYRCLLSEKIETVNDVIKLTKWDLRKITNFGPKSLRDLEQALEKLGLKLEEGNV